MIKNGQVKNTSYTVANDNTVRQWTLSSLGKRGAFSVWCGTAAIKSESLG